jgi:hypothetical protein
MINIKYIDTVETLPIGSLFEQIGFEKTSLPTDSSGDSFIKNEWSLEVKSLDGFYPIEGFRWTKPEKQMLIEYEIDDDITQQQNYKILVCSPEHIVHQQNPDTWIMAKDLKVDDLIITENGKAKISDLSAMPFEDRLCDIQVSIAHSYFTNGILSHNSHFLTALGANALREGKDIVHYTFELSEAAVGRRYDSNLCDIDSNEIIDNKEKIIKTYNDMSSMGRLIIKEFPTNSASIFTLRSHIERLELKGFRPNMIIIDYADIMRSTRQYDSLRHELKLIYEELRGFANEKRLPIWTASQSNKDGSSADVVDLSNMSEAYGKAMVADVVVSISRKAHEKAGGFGRLFVAKNRAGRDGLLFPIRIDTAKSYFEMLGGPANMQEAITEDEERAKNALRDRWNQMRKDDSLGTDIKKFNEENNSKILEIA